MLVDALVIVRSPALGATEPLVPPEVTLATFEAKVPASRSTITIPNHRSLDEPSKAAAISVPAREKDEVVLEALTARMSM
jgi:hypothetical protein